MWSRLAVIGAFVLLVTDGSALLAADPPGRVGRVSFTEGTVSLRPAEQETSQDNPDADWRAAAVNYPVTTGNSLWTESGAKAEVQVGPAEVRLDQQTELEVMRLDDNAVELALHQGNLNIHVSDELPGGLRIGTPRGPVSLMRPGSYRVSVDTTGDSDKVEVVAFDGEAQFAAETEKGTDTHTVRRGESLKLAGTPGEIVLGDAAVNPFDQWAKSRDPGVVMPQQAQAPVQAPVQGAAPVPSGTVQPIQQTTQYVSPQTTGYQDLAPYGTWQQAPNYGAVWYPTTVAADWAPYRYGHWEYIRPWGWTWIDDAPWGFTPFHYGRWVRVGPRWAWWPGHRVVRPVYAPALVAFVGGNGWSVSISSGRSRPVGWVPLAPYEVYRPYYRTSATYVRNVNVTTVNKTVINNITVNKNVEINKYVNRNATTVVSADNFARGRKVNEAKIDVPRKELERARVTNEVRRIQPQQVAARAEAPRPPVQNNNGRRDETRRAANPALTSREQQQPRRDQADVQKRQQAERQKLEHQQPERQQREVHERQQRATQDKQREAQDKQRRDPTEAQQRQQAERQQSERQQAERQQREAQDKQRAAQDKQRRDQAEQTQQREQAERQQAEQQQQQRRQRDAQERQRRDQTEQDQQRREQARQQRDQQQREQGQRQKREQDSQLQQERQQRETQDKQREVQDRQRRGQAEAQQRQQAERQQRAQQEQHQRQAQEQQRRQQEAQQRQAAEQQQRQQAERQQRAQHEQQQRQAQEQQRRQQEAQQRQAAEQQQRQQAERQQRAQQEQQQRQAQEQQRRQQAEQQQRQQQEQAREVERRRGPERRQDPREDKRDRAG